MTKLYPYHTEHKWYMMHDHWDGNGPHSHSPEYEHYIYLNSLNSEVRIAPHVGVTLNEESKMVKKLNESTKEDKQDAKREWFRILVRQLRLSQTVNFDGHAVPKWAQKVLEEEMVTQSVPDPTHTSTANWIVPDKNTETPDDHI